MKCLRPDLLDGLAQEYVMFTMHPQARRRFEAQLHRHPNAQAAVMAWQDCAARLTLGLRPQSPSPRVRTALEAAIAGGLRTPPHAATTSRAPQPPDWRQRLALWMQGWRTGLAALAVGVVLGLGGTQLAPSTMGLEAQSDTVPASYIGVLTNAQDQAALLVSSRRHGHTVQLKLLQPLALPEGKVARLWAYPKDGQAPFLVATLPPQGSTTAALPKTAEALFANVSRLVVSADAPQRTLPPEPADLLMQGHCAKLW